MERAVHLGGLRPLHRGHRGGVRQLPGSRRGKADQRIGKVRVRLSTLEIDRVYTHYYPLMALAPSGLKKTGELHLAVRFTCTAWGNMLGMYGRPLLPKMHYTHPISVLQLDYLRFQAMQMVAEPPLRREVVEYMLDVDSHMFSLRRSKANFYRITSLFSGAVAVAKWMDGICKSLTTVLVHVLFLILVCYPELILPTVFLYLFMVGAWNYRRRPRKPSHMDTVLSHAEPGLVHPDELDEGKPGDVVRMRYDRLRSVAGRVQTVVGDLATQAERAQSLLSWRDPRASAIFLMLSLSPPSCSTSRHSRSSPSCWGSTCCATRASGASSHPCHSTSTRGCPQRQTCCSDDLISLFTYLQ